MISKVKTVPTPGFKIIQINSLMKTRRAKIVPQQD